MSRVFIAGVGMTAFGKHVGKGVRSLAVEAIDKALLDANIDAKSVSRVYFGNAAAGVVSQQEMIRGQVALRFHALATVPLVNIENACASGGSALSLAVEAVASGSVEVALVVGAEQLNHDDRDRPFNALRGSTDIGEIGEFVPGDSTHSLLMDFYAAVAQNYLDQYGATPRDFALVAVKNRENAVHNPLAHLRKPQTVEEVLCSRMIVAPLTLPMCSPTTDGAAALVLCSDSYTRRNGAGAVEILASRIASGASGCPAHDATLDAYKKAAVGPRDFDLIELHDAAAPAELQQYHEIGLCGEGEGAEMIRRGDTAITGRIPVNTSGGLLSRGHPLGATGCAQIVELVDQLLGRAGVRQLQSPQIAMAVNGGGWLEGSYALAVATILAKAK
ncbi:MAG TPA: thiolase family protein [Steroidobacteraceae bacterium]|jgi:acetyl-CoA acetyltransferase|nr:thiolase family protein [Steroidobacteraceae bacterium]